MFCAQRSRIFVCKECFRFLLKWLFFIFTCEETLIKKQLATIKNAVEIEELIEVAEEVKKPEETADIIKQ